MAHTVLGASVETKAFNPNTAPCGVREVLFSSSLTHTKNEAQGKSFAQGHGQVVMPRYKPEQCESRAHTLRYHVLGLSG